MNRDKLERIKTAGSILLVVGCLCTFWVMLFYGICDEVERREGMKSNRKWVQERALNQWETEQRMATVPVQNKPELMKAMQAVSK